jgi:hypothetical protein
MGSKTKVTDLSFQSHSNKLAKEIAHNFITRFKMIYKQKGTAF